MLAADLGADLRGGQRQTLLVARSLALLGDEVGIAALARSPLAAAVAAEPLLTLLEVAPGNEASPRPVLSLRRAVQAFRPEALWVGDSRAHGAAVWGGLHRRVPLVVHRRVVFPPGGDPFSRYKYSVAARFLAVSSAAARSLSASGVPVGKIRLVPDGLSPEAFRPSTAPPLPPLRLVHAGAFDGRKGQRVAVETLARLGKTGVEARLDLLGDGPDRPATEGEARRLGVDGCCSFHGWVTETAPFFAASHALLLPSDSEAAALVLVEAMAAGCIPIAHDVGGCAEVLGGGEGGVLVSSLDPYEWALAVARLASDAAGRARLEEGGRRLASARSLMRTTALVREELVRAAAKFRGPT